MYLEADPDGYRYPDPVPTPDRPKPGGGCGRGNGPLRLWGGHAPPTHARPRAPARDRTSLSHALALGPHRRPDRVRLWQLLPWTPRRGRPPTAATPSPRPIGDGPSVRLAARCLPRGPRTAPHHGRAGPWAVRRNGS